MVWETQILDYKVNPANQTSGRSSPTASDLRPQLRSARRAAQLRRYGARPGNRRGAVADAADPGARRAGERIVGRRAVRGARSCRRLDGAELRSGVEPDLPRHVGHLARAQVPGRRDRQGAPLPQLDPGAGCGYGRHRLALPAPQRQLGSRPPVRAPARGYAGAAGPGRGELDQPAPDAGGRSAAW